MSLRRALLLSFVLHLSLGAAAGSWLLAPTERAAAPPEDGREPLAFNLVDPATASLGDEDVAPRDGAVERRAGARSPRAGAGGRSPGADPNDPAGEPSEAREEVAAAHDAANDLGGPGVVAGSTTMAPARRPAVVPGRLSPRELAEFVGLEADGLDDEILQGMFSAMHKYALQSPQPAASTYRTLLRAWIDGLMGYPYPILEDLAAFAEHRFIGGIRIEVGADGRFRLVDLWLYTGITDPDERLAGYYRRVIRDAEVHRFLPPGRAGLPAPHALEYRIVNPRALR